MEDGWAEGSVVSMGPLQVRLVGEVKSTQDELWSKRRWAQEGTGIAAASQTAGHGRGGAPWASPPGGVYVSLLVGRGMRAADADLLGEAGALAVLRACEEFLKGDDLFAKWPNDIVTWGPARKIGKLAGVIVRLETEGDKLAHAVVGLGINVRKGIEQGAVAGARSAPVSLEGLSQARGIEWNAPRTKVLEWVVGWYGVFLARAREDPASVRREFGREVARGPLRAVVPGVRDELKPLGVSAGGQLDVRRKNGKRATVALEDAQRLQWRILPRPKQAGARAKPKPKSAKKKPIARGARARPSSRR